MNLLTDLSLSASIVIVTIFSIFWQTWKFIKSYKKTPCFPPGPRGLPIVGYLPFLRSDLHIQFAELARKHGPIYKLWLGNKLYIVISSTSLIKEVLRDHDVIFANRALTVTSLIASYNAEDVGFSNYGDQWNMSRRVFMGELMSNDSLDGTYDLRKDEVRKEIGNVHSKIGRNVNIRELTLRISVNSALRMIWGSTFGLEKREKIGAEFLPLLSSITEVFGKPNISDYFPFLARFDIQGVEKEMKEMMRIIDGVLEDLIDTCVKMKSQKVGEQTIDKGGKDFVQMLVELMENEDDTKMSLTRTHIKGILSNIILGATHTSSTTVEWVMAELMSNPKEMSNVHKELNEVVGLNNVVEEFHIYTLEYLDAVIKETLRLHPIGPFLTPRTPSESCIVGGFTIPKDSAIFLSLWSIHKDPLVWENPLEFKPQRFLSNTGNLDFSGNNLNYIPFGSGRRICAGLALANRMVKYELASLLHSFEWKLPEGEELDMEDKLGSLLRKKNPLFAVPIPRLSDSDMYV